MKKMLLGGGLCIAMAASLLAGCSGKSTEEGKNAEEKKTIKISTTGEHAFFSETKENCRALRSMYGMRSENA